MKKNTIEEMLSVIDTFYDKKMAIASLYERGEISLDEFYRRSKALDGELDEKLPDYNENEELSLYELKQFAHKQ